LTWLFSIYKVNKPTGQELFMRTDLQQAVQQLINAQSLDMGQVSAFSPADFRIGIQHLLAQDKMALAQALADAGVSLHPQSEDVLAIAGLLAAAQQNWPLAIELLKDLCTVQKDQVQPMTYQMLARAYYCQLDLTQARQILENGLVAWPEHPLLLAECDALGHAVTPWPISAQLN
jgi:tetratricopeptide (TPR) repeat protein